ncbi:MAG: hypothetical protein WCT18_03880 [Patescibacteria group bacterium]
MKEPTFKKEIPKPKNLDRTEAKEKIPPEYVLYHNAIHLELHEGEAIEFFAPKSEMTLRINNKFQETTKQIPEVQSLIKSNKLLEVKALLLDTEDVLYFDGRRKRVIQGLITLLDEMDIPEVKKLLNDSIDILHFRWLMEDQLGKKNTPTDVSKLKKLKEIRDQSYFLTKEDESVRGYDLISFDIRKLLGYGFTIYEANNEMADSIAKRFSSIQEIRKYLESFKEIKSPTDCLKYSTEFQDDYDSGATETVYKPYCPEYLVQPPTPEIIAELIKDRKIKGHEDINMNNLDFTNPKNYRLIVDLLFNDAITDMKVMKQKESEKTS